jgi:hypothetical protein
MRGRFNSKDGHLYACGMSAWGTNQMMKGGGLYRVRYTGNRVTVPVGLETSKSGVILRFANRLDRAKAVNPSSYQVSSWEIVRSSNYGSQRYNVKHLEVMQVYLPEDGKSVKLSIDDIEPVDIMTLKFDILDDEGNPMKGTVQNTIHKLKFD